MKHIYITMMMTALLIAGGHHAFAAKRPLITDIVSFEKSDSTAEVSLLVHWPCKGEQVLVDSLRHHIADLLGGEFNSPDDILSYGASLFESLSADWHSVYDEMPPEERLGAFSKSHHITKLAETSRYITYYYQTYDYGGGIHGYTTEVGFTFRKSDGKQIPLLANTDSPRLAQLIKEGVRRYFANNEETEMSDEALTGELFINDVDDLNHLPLPGNAPYLTETGVVFLYTQYEIAPYSSGIITFEIPFKDIRPFLTPDAQKLIPSE
jgi:hypothetical protein